LRIWRAIVWSRVERGVSSPARCSAHGAGVGDAQVGNRGDVAAVDEDAERFGTKALSLAGGAGDGRHVLFDLVADVVGVGLAVAALEVVDNTFVLRVIGLGAAVLVGEAHVDDGVAGTVEDSLQLFISEVADGGTGGEAQTEKRDLRGCACTRYQLRQTATRVRWRHRRSTLCGPG
jgi:hypothetical protein